eukprot:gene9771-1475_t
MDKIFLRGLVREIAELDLFKHRSRADYKFVAVSADRPPTWQLLRKRARLNTLKLRGRALQYKMLGEIDSINTVEGECVVDALYHTMKTQCKRYQTITKRQIRAEFTNISNGIDVNQIIAFAKKYKLSIHALDPFMRVFYTQIEENRRGSFCSIVNNGHLYPITDDVYKKSIFENGRLELGKVIKEEFCNDKAIEVNLEEMLEAVDIEDEKHYYGNRMDLHEVAVQCVKDTGNTIVEMDCREGGVY